MRRWVAQYYKVPLTDPRLDLYTDELLAIEMAFLKKERPDMFAGEHFDDPYYEDWVKKVTAEDSKIIRDDKERAERVITRPIEIDASDVPASDINLDDSSKWEPVE